MDCIVVGAGAWGLPAAAELARRGHRVRLVDRYGPANALSSSPGPTRIWRLTHADAPRVKLALRSVEAMQTLARRSGRTVFLRRGLLWRDGAQHAEVIGALTAHGVPHVVVDPADVGLFLPGLVPDGRPGVWVDEAGPVLAAASLQAQRALFEADGGELVVGHEVDRVEPHPRGVRVLLRPVGEGADDDARGLDADVVVLAAGPGSDRLLAPLLEPLGINLPLMPRLEQVVHFGSTVTPSASDHLPCLIDHDDAGGGIGVYAMPTPGLGYKVGIDRPRPFHPTDRTPDPDQLRDAVSWVRDRLTSVEPTVLDATVCCWTDSPDRRFVVDRLPGGVVLACGDSGEGFKFSALMGPVLADLAEDRPTDPDITPFGLARFTTSTAPA